MSTIVVNLFGAPSCGKSTGAAYVFSSLKLCGVNAELVTEFAKDKVWEENSEIFKPLNQVYIFGKQFYKLSRCYDKVDVIVTDSPLLLSSLYNKSEVLGEEFDKTVMKCFKMFDNRSYLLERAKPYNPVGRLQTEEESNKIQDELISKLKEWGILYKTVRGDIDGYNSIVDDILTELRGE